MRQVVLLLRRIDVQLYRHNFGEQFPSLFFVTQNPEAYELALQFGARNVRLIEPPRMHPNHLNAIHIRADRLARQWDRRFSEMREAYMGYEFESLGWEYLFIYFSSIALDRANWYAEPLVDSLPDAESVVFFNFKNPMDFYMDSAPLRRPISDELRKKYSSVIELSLESEPFYSPKASSFKLQIPEGKFRILSHLPTTFYERAKHAARLKNEFGAAAVDLQSPHWDCPVLESRICLGESSQGHRRPSQFARYMTWCGESFRQIFSQIGVQNEDDLTAQVSRQVAWSESQLMAFETLRSADHLSSVERVDVACHDGGLLGPLLTWAVNSGKFVEVWPHSTVVNSPIPPIGDGIVHSLSRKPCPFITLGSTPIVNFQSVSRLKPSRVGRNVLFLFTEFRDNLEIPICSIREMRDALNGLIFRLREAGYNCMVRQKPSKFYPTLLSFDIAASADGPLDSWVDWTDICISVGQATSASNAFWMNGAICFHVQEHVIQECDLYTIPEDDFFVFDGRKYAESFLLIHDSVLNLA